MAKITGKASKKVSATGAGVRVSVSTQTFNKMRREYQGGTKYIKALAEMKKTRKKALKLGVGKGGVGGRPLKKYKKPKILNKAATERAEKYTEYLKKRIATTEAKIEQEKKYEKSLSEMERQKAKALNIGATGKNGKPLKGYKRPQRITEASIRAVENYTEYLKDRISVAEAKKEYEDFLKEQGGFYDANSPDRSVIDRLIQYANDVMMGNEIIAGIPNRGMPSGVPNALTEVNSNFILNTLDDAEDDLGTEQVVENIRENYTAIKQMIADILLAIYKKDTAKWGGGSVAFELLKIAFRDLIYGRS